MQTAMLSRGEREFFASEPAVYYWAKTMRPDLLMFGFTMAQVTMIVSEALKIPLIGFVLQPTSIPSKAYPPVLPLNEAVFEAMSLEDNEKQHEIFNLVKHFMENSPLTRNVNSMRERRALLPIETSHKEEKHTLANVGKLFGATTWRDLQAKNVPLVVPINETMFGGKPADWSSNSVFTDSIFLRGDTVPKLAPDAQAFIDNAKTCKGKVVVLAFSSMPVSKSDISRIALKLIHRCREPVHIFALAASQIDAKFDSDELKANTEKAIASKRLFLTKGAPFGQLFPLVDAVVLHGGLGTTCEALLAKVPVIVTGVLLLDQRFWGARCASLGVGPFGLHIKDFPKKCVEYVDKALEDGSVWKANAMRIGQLMLDQSQEDPSGVVVNVDAVASMSKIAVPYTHYEADEEAQKNDNIVKISTKIALGTTKDVMSTLISKATRAKNEPSSEPKICSLNGHPEDQACGAAH
jgi:hypothetical protein